MTALLDTASTRKRIAAATCKESVWPKDQLHAHVNRITTAVMLARKSTAAGRTDLDGVSAPRGTGGKYDRP